MSDKKSPAVFIVEDERPLSLALAATVKSCGGEPHRFSTLNQARQALKERGVPAAIILDIGLPDGNGLSLLESLTHPVPVLVVTAHGEIENAIAARKLGVREFFDKPIEFAVFRRTLSELIEEQAKGREVTDTEESESTTFIGAAPSMRAVFQKIAHACASREPVTIIGKTGTGKSAVCRLIAREESSDTGCGGLDWFQSGSGETGDTHFANSCLLIDPVTRLGNADQLKLLEILESESEAPRRIIVTAETGLHDLVKTGELRSDLYYRLQVLEIRLPLLCDRVADIPALADNFLGRIAGETVSISPEALAFLQAYEWPGNLRELQNVIAYANTVRSGNRVIVPGHLPDHLLHGERAPVNPEESSLSEAIEEWLGETDRLPDYRSLSGSLERMLIERLLLRFDNKLAPMAKALKANRTTLRKKWGKQQGE